MLIVLDNCEHVVDAAAAVVEEILRMTPGISILATSREPLRCAGKFIHRVASLEIPLVRAGITADEAAGYASVRLFNERAQREIGTFTYSHWFCRKFPEWAGAIQG
jgi:predicted ATPase